MDYKKYQADLYYKDLETIGFDVIKNLVLDGFNVVIRRVGGNHLCGYVEVPEGLDVNAEVITCHGGITFNSSGVNGFPTNGYYIGFDCGHATDWNPYFWREGTYKDTGFVLGEIWHITQQLKEMQNEHNNQ